MNQPWKLIALGLVTIAPTVGCRDSSQPSTPPAAPASGNVPGTTRPGNSPAGAANSAPDQAAAQGVTKIPRDQLPIGDYMPPLDEDRIEIAKPKNWQALPRDSDFLTRFYESNRNGLPRIEITVKPQTYGDLTTVTAENVEQFAQLVAADLGELELVEKVLPLQVGSTPCARYVGRVDLKLATGQTISAERQRLLVLQDSRLYTIDLLVMPNTLRKSRNAAYAVCASLRFGGGGEPPAAGDLLPGG